LLIDYLLLGIVMLYFVLKMADWKRVLVDPQEGSSAIIKLK
jgi:hypothetical protein